MEPIVSVLVVGLVLLAVLAAFAARRRRDAALEPVRLGPSWEPREPRRAEAAAADASPDPRVEILQERSGVDPGTVAAVLTGWDEHLAVLGFLSLPPEHRYRVYDPYDPPVATRGPDHQPVADPDRVARDVARRLSISERDARSVLEALLDDPESDVADEPRVQRS